MDVKQAFEFLGLPVSATVAEVKKQYYRLARERHPDAGGDENQFRVLYAAYAVALRHASEPKVCEACHGNGTIIKMYGFSSLTYVCETCNGKGKV